MRIIDVCDNVACAGCIKKYYENNNINDFKILPLMIELAMGDLNNHLSFLNDVYYNYGFYFDYNEYVGELIDSVDKNTIVRVWSSRSNSNDYLLLLYMCNLLKDKCIIHVVFPSDSINIDILDSKDIPLLLEQEKILTIDEVNKYIEEWNKELNINSDIRVMENGIIVNKNYSDYDDIILNYLNKLGRCKIVNLVEQLIHNHVINDLSAYFYEYLINRLIEVGKIKIVKKEDIYSHSIIEKS